MLLICKPSCYINMIFGDYTHHLVGLRVASPAAKCLLSDPHLGHEVCAPCGSAYPSWLADISATGRRPRRHSYRYAWRRYRLAHPAFENVPKETVRCASLSWLRSRPSVPVLGSPRLSARTTRAPPAPPRSELRGGRRTPRNARRTPRRRPGNRVG
jgi:hypothetical protein